MSEKGEPDGYNNEPVWCQDGLLKVLVFSSSVSKDTPKQARAFLQLSLRPVGNHISSHSSLDKFHKFVRR
jgi:hypothetical protein